jgi:hypothetical protein
MRHNYGGRLSLVLRVLLLVALLFYFLPEERGQSLTPSSSPPVGIWQALNEQIPSLLPAFDSFEVSLTKQLDSLKLSNQSLANSNHSLQVSNDSLTESLKRSKYRAAISEEKSKQLQTDLDASTLSITQARIDAKALELSLSGWKIAGCVGIVAGLAGLIYGLTR